MEESVLDLDDLQRLHAWLQRGGSIRGLVRDGFGPEEMPPALRSQYQHLVDLQQDMDDAVERFNTTVTRLAKTAAEEAEERQAAAGRAHP